MNQMKLKLNSLLIALITASLVLFTAWCGGVDFTVRHPPLGFAVAIAIVLSAIATLALSRLE